MTHRTRIAVWTALAAFHVGLGLPNAASATPTLVFSHVGDTDPEDVSEGWTRTGLASPGVIDAGAADVEIGPVSPDPNCRGCGLDAWGADDRSPDEGTVLRYEHQVTRAQVRDASNMGWTLRIHLRVASESDFPNSLDDFWLDSAIFAEYTEQKSGNGNRFRLPFGANLWGEPVVRFSTDTGYSVYHSAGATEDYMLYELMYRPSAGDATLFVDGVERLSGYQGEDAEASAGLVHWGSDSRVSVGPFTGDGTGRGHFGLVEWEIGLPVCFDEVDNDGDGLVDLADPSCLDNPSGSTESLTTECDDGLDNDADGEIELADPGCGNDASRITEETECDDGLDNDSDGYTDLSDPTCAGDASNIAEATACDDGVDNDSDGFVDLADAGCRAQIARDDESGEIVVNTTLDKVDADAADAVCETDVVGECSLRAAIMQSNWAQGPDGIQIPAGMFELTISPWPRGRADSVGDLDIHEDLTLIGAGAALTRIGGDEGLFEDQIFNITAPARVDFRNLTIQKGYYDYLGGGILAWPNTSVSLTGCLVTENRGDYNGSGIWSRGALALTNTTVSENYGASNPSDDDTCLLAAEGDLPNTESLLGPLADNGGPTLTHLPILGSPVIDAADNAACPATDQRGVARYVFGLNFGVGF